MKNNKKLFALSTVVLMLVACGGGKGSNPKDSSISSNSTSETSYNNSSSPEESSSRRPLISSSSSSSSKTSSATSTTTSTGSSIEGSDDIPTKFKILLHADAANEGLTVTAPSEAYSGREVELTVKLEAGYILEYIRLNAPTAAEGGVRVNPNADGKYVFVMPDGPVNVYYKGVKGYKVNFAGTNATAELAAESAEYDLFGEGYPVYVCKKSVAAGYYFVGFEVKDASGNKINTWNDAIDQVGFRMPKGDVTVTALAEKVDTSVAAITGTYANGVAIDMNTIDDNGFVLTIGADMSVKLTTDWANPDWYGTYTYKDNVLEADVTNLSIDGFYTSTTRHLKVEFLNGGKYLAAEFSSETATYRYMFGKASEGLHAKKLYMSALQDGDYTRAHRIVSFSASSGDFFTYVNPTRTKGYYYLNAFEKGTTTQVYAFTSGKTYTMKDAEGNAVIEAAYDGKNITVAAPEEPVDPTPGPGGDSGDTQTAPFMNKTYYNDQIKIYNEDGYDPQQYEFRITFGSKFGVVTEAKLSCVESPWQQYVSDRTYKNDVTYTYDETSGDIVISGMKSGSQTVTLSYQPNGTIIYKGKVIGTEYEICSGNNNIILKEAN